MEMLTSIILDMNSCTFYFTSVWLRKKLMSSQEKPPTSVVCPQPRHTVPCISAHQNLEKLNLKLI